MAQRKVVSTGRSRVWITEGGSGPSRAPVYQEFMRAGAGSWPRGAPGKIEVPSAEAYDGFTKAETVPAEDQDPTLALVDRMTGGRSVLLKLRELSCEWDAQIHFGRCQDPRDFNDFDKALIIEKNLSDWSTGDMGALASSERAAVDENATATGSIVYEVFTPLSYAALAASQITVEVTGIEVCDRPTCAGTCGAGSDGCQRVFAVTVDVGGSPAVSAVVAFTEDGGSNWSTTEIDSMSDTGEATDVACVGRYLVVTEEVTAQHHYALIEDIIEGTETWAAVSTGYNSGDGGTAIFSLGATLTWIAGLDGRVYFSEDITAGVEIQLNGTLTTEDYNDIHGIDADNLVVCGDLNEMAKTVDGGATWAEVTGPSVGDNLLTVCMRTADEWLVGNDDGELWLTVNAGRTWTQVTSFSGSATGAVEKVRFVPGKASVGYMSHTLAGVARLFRTFDGGHSWVLQEDLPSGNQRFNDLALCTDPNRVFAGGLGVGTDGAIIKGVA